MTVKCETCGVYNAKYVCQNCGARVCSLCFNPYTGLCVKCAKNLGLEEQYRRVEKPGAMLGFKLIMVGFILTFLGAVIMVISAIFTGKLGDLSFVILLLPIPIGVAAGPYGWLMLIAALILAIIFTSIIVFKGKRLKRA